MIRHALTALLLLLTFAADAQTYKPQKTAWSAAGYSGAKPAFPRTRNVVDYGADTSGFLPADAALADAIAALGGQPGTIYFPPGAYLFTAQVRIGRDSISLSGAGYDATVLRFSLGGRAENLVSIAGSEGADTAMLTRDALRSDTAISISVGAAIRTGDWVTLGMDDQEFMTSSWAYGSLAQTVQVAAIRGETLFISSPLRAGFLRERGASLRRIIPRNNVGIECLKLQRLDATAGQSSNIIFDRAVNCWVAGVESDTANFAHIEINRSSNIEVTGCYIHDAFAYGGGGQGYGILLQFGSGACKAEANYFNHLRHSMVLQAGANGNVLAYNYSAHPFWTEPNLPDSSAGEIVLHGNYPFMNLAEGNIVSNIVIDDSHGRNGPLNTFFRNRAGGYGIFMNFNPATDSVQLIGNEITNGSIGLYFINGRGHFSWGNNYRGTVIGGPVPIPDSSLYLTRTLKPLCAANWSVIGSPGGYNTGSVWAKERLAAGRLASCSCPQQLLPAGIPAAPVRAGFTVYPNPANDFFRVEADGAFKAALYDVSGRLVLSGNGTTATRFSVRLLPPGIYTLRIISRAEVAARRIVVSR